MTSQELICSNCAYDGTHDGHIIRNEDIFVEKVEAVKDKLEKATSEANFTVENLESVLK